LEEEIEMPRSHSLPNLIFNPDIEEYQYEMKRDFRGELQNYFYLKKAIQKKKRD
jgi:hypothetical protein